MKFSELNLHPGLQQGLNEADYITCMPVQEQVLAHAFNGQDLYVQSQTGTGKTAAFLVVIFQRLLTEDMLHGKKAIIMVPTRELAVQVEEEAKLIGKYLNFKTGSFYGGVGYAQQTALLKDNAQILVGTPGRVLDLNQSGQMNLMEIAFLVLDEADRMFDMGFYPDLRKLIRAVPPADRRQTMLFSATLNAWVKNLAWEYTRNPFEIAIEPETVTVEEVDQILYHVSSGDKMKLLLGILKREDPESALIFCNTKRYAEITAKRLRLNGYECEYIMGDLPQVKRLKIIDEIKAGKLHLLVATDVAARGLDIEGLTMVVNYDIPNEPENYVHRIGRTARAGKTGKAISLASEQDVYELPGIERYIGGKIPSEHAEEEFFAEDKSEGKHIHTDLYDDRSSGREGRPHRHDHEGRRTPEGRHGHKDHGRGHEHGKPRDAKNRTGKPGGGDRTNTIKPGASAGTTLGHGFHSGGQQPNVKLSELTLEERMAYYKQKYDKGGNTHAPQKEADQNERKSGKKKQDKAAKGRKRGRDKSKHSQNPAAENSVSVSKEAAAQGDAPKAGRKGILSRLLGVFKKK